MPGPFGRAQNTRPKPKPRTMTYDGNNGPEIVDWARDDDLSLRFALSAGEARLKQPAGDGQGDEWVPVPVGSTIIRDDAGELTFEPPAEPQEASE